MNHGIEIRWHGRGGQGAKTAALLLADVALRQELMYRDFLNMVRSVWEHRSQHITGSAEMR